MTDRPGQSRSISMPNCSAIRRIPLTLFVLTLSVLAAPSAVHAAVPILDQSHSAVQISVAGFSGASLRRGQIFTVGVTGALSRIEVAVTGNNSTLVMDVMSVVGGLPDTVLATATNPTDMAAGVKAFDFTGSGVIATTSDELAFLLSDPTNNAGLTNTADSYAGGSRVSTNDGGTSWILNPSDSNFSTWVVPPRVLVDAAIVVGASPALENAGGTLRILQPEVTSVGVGKFVVPEPGLLSQLGPGLVLLGGVMRRRARGGQGATSHTESPGRCGRVR
jgi:hypothetical protein